MKCLIKQKKICLFYNLSEHEYSLFFEWVKDQINKRSQQEMLIFCPFTLYALNNEVIIFLTLLVVLAKHFYQPEPLISALIFNRPAFPCRSSSWLRVSSRSSSWRKWSSASVRWEEVTARGRRCYQRTGTATATVGPWTRPTWRAAGTTSTSTSRPTPPFAPSCSSSPSHSIRCLRGSLSASRAPTQRWEDGEDLGLFFFILPLFQSVMLLCIAFCLEHCRASHLP